jgi:dihydroflavonol-4-reductase
VRDLSREAEVRAAVGSEVPTDNLSVIAADLRADDGWEEAARGCDYILHVASPFPAAQPKDPDELIVPAREGTLRVLRAALAAEAERVVVTSSVAAVSGGAKPGKPLDEGDWTDPANTKLSPYVRSKTIAEQAAWDLVREAGAEERLAVVNPGAIIGPLLDGGGDSFSLELVERLLKGTPGIPRIGFSIVDVRDVADLHIRAMTAPAAGGERFVAVAQFRWMAEVAEVLRDRLGSEAAKVPTRRVPDLVVRGMGLFDPGVRSIVNQLGKKLTYSGAKAERLLEWSPRPVEDSIVECARSLIRQGAA